MKNELVAVVLAGGEGKRFWPLTTNKVLFPFLGKPLIEYSIIDQLPDEVDRVVVVTSKGNDEAIAKLHFSKPTTRVIQQHPSGMGEAVLCAREMIAGCQLLLLNADDITDSALASAVLRKAKETKAFGVFPGWKIDQYFPLGYLELEGEQAVGIVEKPGVGNEPSPYAYLVCNYLADSDKFLASLSQIKSSNDDIYERALTVLMKNETCLMLPYEGTFAPLKYPWKVLDIMDELLQRIKSYRGKNIQIKSNVVIEGPVYIEDDVKIFENTKIVGPCYIGKGTIIGNNNMIRHSHIGEGCVTGFSTDITRSYIGDSCWFHMNYIGDSVLEGGISMGGGALLANLRLDDGDIRSTVRGEKISTGRSKLGAIIGKNVRIGANTTIMPGVKIGAETFVGSGIVVGQDVAEHSYCVGETKLVITKNKASGQPDRTAFKQKI